jgi:hypothetical protein
MRKELLGLMITALLIVGIAGAALPAMGPNQGFSTKGSLEVAKDLTVGGSVTVGGVSIVNGVVSDDLVMDSNKDFSTNAGTSVFDWRLATGKFYTSTGINYLMGDVEAAGDIDAVGDGTFDGISVAALDARIDVYDVDFPANVTRIETLEGYVGDPSELDTAADNLVAAINATDGRIEDLETAVGTVANLDTTATDLTEAVNELLGTIGPIALIDVAADDLVAAINGTTDRLDDAEEAIGTVTNLETTATDLTEAVNEVLGLVGPMALLDVAADDLVAAINATTDRLDAVEEAIGTIGDLDTTATDLVGAVNETYGMFSGLQTDHGNNVTRIAALETASFPITFNYDAASVDRHIFVANGAYVVTGIKMIPRVVGSNGGAVNVMLKLCDDDEAPSAGDDALTGTLDLKGTADRIQSGTLSGTPTLADGDSLALDFTGTLTDAVGTITVYVRRA